MLLKINCVN